MKHTAMAAAALGLVASAVHAAEIKFEVIEARFIDAIGGNILQTTPPAGAFGDPATIAWGQNGLTPLVESSGYVFDPDDTPFLVPAVDPFQLGLFEHVNRPISSGTSITGVTLEVRATIGARFDPLAPFDPLGERTFAFDIAHNETPNGANPCDSSVPDRSDPVNANGCADEVSFSIAAGSDAFTVGGADFTLDVLGFSVDLADAVNGIFDPTFLSPEGGANTRILSAAFVADPRTTSDVPLPAGMGLLMLGGAALVGLRLRRA